MKSFTKINLPRRVKLDKLIKSYLISELILSFDQHFNEFPRNLSKNSAHFASAMKKAKISKRRRNFITVDNFTVSCEI